ncbi:hypothetical protein [Paenibacillus peoriae]|uniref:hypothetical protein n=1 Tax=Paenibacillus peoriae TaxID=59893 RepID=UPI003F9D5E5E
MRAFLWKTFWRTLTLLQIQLNRSVGIRRSTGKWFNIQEIRGQQRWEAPSDCAVALKVTFQL